MIMSDLTSQLIILTYSLYTIMYKVLYSVLNKLLYPFNKTITPTSSNFSEFTTKNDSLVTNNSCNTSNIHHILSSNQKPSFIPKLSKVISKLNLSFSYFNSNTQIIPTNETINKFFLQNNNYLNLLLSLNKCNPVDSIKTFDITSTEVSYIPVLDKLSLKTHNTSLNLNELYKLSRSSLFRSKFNFNLESHLNISNQQRWLTKNSLLSESIIHNSFRITQAKKLLGTGLLNPNYTSNSL